MTERVYKASQFEVFEELGRGAFGVVYRGFDKVRKIDVAIKQVDLESNNEMDEIQQEIRMLSTCHCEYVTRYYGCFLKGFKLWIIMEYMGGGSCADLLAAGPFGEPAIGLILSELLKALEYLHNNGKIHRDIKAANLLVSSIGEVKIADFGVATQLSNKMSRRNTFVGTPYWMAPEIIKHKEYAFSADIWSLGITAIELAYGKPPYSQFHPFDVLVKITDEPSPTLGSDFSSEFNSFVSRCLQKDPSNRPTASELLNHRFIRKHWNEKASNITELIEKKVRWDLETGNVDRKYYAPTQTRETVKDEVFDLGTLTVQGKENVSPTKLEDSRRIVPQSPLKHAVCDDDWKLRKELNSILNQSFNKISEKYNLSTYEYDNLVKFQTTLMDSLFLDKDHEYRQVFSKFFKLVLKRIMRSDDTKLKEKMLPRYFTNLEREWLEFMAKEEGSSRSRDEVEELLLTRWAENMLDR